MMHMVRMSEKKDRLSWYFYRIASMSVPEIMYRLRWKLRQDIYYRPQSKRGMPAREDTLGRVSSQDLLGWFRRQEHAFLARTGTGTYKKRFPAKKVIKLADRYCQNRFTIYEYTNVLHRADGSVDWLTDFKSGKQWPLCFEGDIYHNTRKMSIRYLWEHNRMLHLYTLGKAYAATGNEKYAGEVIANIMSWSRQNPYLKGPNWFSPLEHAIRIITWSWALAFIRNSKSLDEDSFDLIMQLIAAKADYIYHNLSLYSSANNHLIGELAGLAVAGTCYPWMPNAKKWRQKAYPMLHDELSRQFHSDGVPAEQSMNYALFTMDFYFQAYLAKGSFPGKLLTYVDRVAHFLLNMMDSHGNMPSVGDSDEGRVTELNLPNWIDTEQGNNYHSFLNTAALLLNKPEYLAYSSGLDEKTYFIMGKDAISRFSALKNKNKKRNKKYLFPRAACFREGGYTVLRGGAGRAGRAGKAGKTGKTGKKPYRLIFDHGPLGYLSICAHGHADALSVILSVDGKEFLTDPNTYVYHEGGIWRDYFRKTAAHNTVVVDDTDQSEMRGVSIWGRKASARLLSYHDGKEETTVNAQHDGYTRLAEPVIHAREIIHDKNRAGFAIVDSFSGKGEHNITLCFNLHPEVMLQKKGKNTLELVRGRDRVRLGLDPRLQIKLYKGSIKPIAGWYSPRFGVKVAAYSVMASVKADLREISEIRTRVQII